MGKGPWAFVVVDLSSWNPHFQATHMENSHFLQIFTKMSPFQWGLPLPWYLKLQIAIYSFTLILISFFYLLLPPNYILYYMRAFTFSLSYHLLSSPLTNKRVRGFVLFSSLMFSSSPRHLEQSLYREKFLSAYGIYSTGHANYYLL